MGNIGSRLIRPLKNYNIENRAHKAISKPKRPAAPTFDGTYKQIELVNKLEPEYKELSQKKNIELDENLKKVYVTSSNAELEKIGSRNNPDRPLPKDNYLKEPFEYGFYEPEKIRPGKVSLRQVVEFITKHNQNPKTYTAENIAKEYNIDVTVAAGILEYVKVFQAFKENKEDDYETVAMPISLRSGIVVHQIQRKKNPKASYDKLEPEKLDQIEEKAMETKEKLIAEKKSKEKEELDKKFSERHQ